MNYGEALKIMKYSIHQFTTSAKSVEKEINDLKDKGIHCDEEMMKIYQGQKNGGTMRPERRRETDG